MAKLNRVNLYIDTTDFNRVIFAVGDGKKINKKSYKIDPRRSHETLAKLDDFFLKSNPHAGGLNLKSAIAGIIVNKGPGSYTGVRVGVTMAQALGFAWKVPVKAVANKNFKFF